MADRINPVFPGCCYITSGSTKERIYHCFGATVLVHEDYLTVISEDLSKARRGLEGVIGHSLIPFTKAKHHHSLNKQHSG